MATLNNVIANANGCVGIGTSSPTVKLDVVGSATVSNALTVTGTTALNGAVNLSTSGTPTITLGSASSYGVLAASGTNAASIYLNGASRTGFEAKLQFGAAEHQWFNGSLSSQIMTLNTTGLGIGTSSPTGTYGKLTVAGGIRTLDDNNSKLELGRYSAGASNSYIKLGTNSNALHFTNAADNADIFTILNGGNVGIGTTSPAYKLDVVGSINTSNFMFVSYQYGNAFPLQLNAANFLKTNDYYYGMTINSGDVNYISGKFLINGGTYKRVELYGYENSIGYIPTVIPGGCVGIGTTNTTSGLQIQTEGTNTTSGSFLFVRSTNASFGGGAIGVGYQYAAAVGNNFTPFRIRAGTTNAIFTVNSAGTIYAGDSTGAIAYGNHDPYFAFNQDTNTGMDWASSDTLTFKTGGTERVRIDSTGCVGIGTSTVKLNSLLTVNGSGAFGTSAYGFYVGADGTGAFLDAGTQSIRMFAGQTERIRITSGGNVGIGTTSPASKLDVYCTSSINTSNYYGLSRYNASLTSNASNGQVGILFSTLSNSSLPANASIHAVPVSDYRSGIVSTYSADAYGAGYFYVNQFIPVSSTTVTRFAINNDGNVGIGTTAPAAKLHISGSSNDQLPQLIVHGVSAPATFNWASTFINAALGSSRNYISLIGQALSSRNSGYIGFNHSGTSGSTTNFLTFGLYGVDNILNINGAGNVGIGTTIPSGSFHIYKSTSYNTILETTTANNVQLRFRKSGTDKWSIYVGNSSNDLTLWDGTSDRVTFQNGGNVGIGTSSPLGKLHIYGFLRVGGAANDQTGTIALGNDTHPTGTYGDNGIFRGGIGSIGSGNYTNVSSYQGIVFNVGNAAFGSQGTKMIIDVNGNVGIGTSSPNNKTTIEADATGAAFADNGVGQLVIRGATNTAKRLGLGIDTTNNIGVIQAQLYGTGNYPLVLNPAGGNVGIGTTSAASLLSVQGDINSNYNSSGTSRVWRTFATDHAAGNRGAIVLFGMYDGSPAGMNVVNAASSNPSYNSQYLTFLTHEGGVSANERMRITATGDILISTTTSPSSAGISLGATGTVRQILGGMQNTSWRIREKSAVDWCAWTTNINDAGTQDDASKSSWLTQQGFGNGNDAWRVGRYPAGSSTLSEFVYINSSGNVGIGTSSPVAKLHIRGGTELLNTSGSTSSATSGSLMLIGQNTKGGAAYHDFLYVRNTKSNNLNTQKYFRLNNSGSVEIINNAYSTTIFTLTDAGVLSTPGGGTSDRRVKNNIQYIYEDVLPTINQLKPASFEFKDNPNVTRHGFIAQDVLNVKREFVLGDGDSETGTYGLDYDGILAMTVKALQEANAKIENLEKEVEILKNRL